MLDSGASREFNSRPFLGIEQSASPDNGRRLVRVRPGAFQAHLGHHPQHSRRCIVRGSQGTARPVGKAVIHPPLRAGAIGGRAKRHSRSGDFYRASRSAIGLDTQRDQGLAIAVKASIRLHAHRAALDAVEASRLQSKDLQHDSAQVSCQPVRPLDEVIGADFHARGIADGLCQAPALRLRREILWQGRNRFRRPPPRRGPRAEVVAHDQSQQRQRGQQQERSQWIAQAI